jgi:ribosomal protein S1
LPEQFGEGIDFMWELPIGRELAGVVSHINTREGVYVDIGLLWASLSGGRRRALIPLTAIPRFTSVRIGQDVKVRIAKRDPTTYTVWVDLVEPRFVHFKVG